MDSRFLNQRKEAFSYNQQKNVLLTTLTEPLRTYFDIDLFFRGDIFFNSKNECTGQDFLITNLDFIDSYIHGFDDNRTGGALVKAIKETPFDSYSYLPLSGSTNCPLFQLLHQKFNFSKGLFIYKRCKDYLEAWWFVGKDSAKIPWSITKSSLAPFQDFMRYFDTKQISHSPLTNYEHMFDVAYEQTDMNQLQGFRGSLNSGKFALNLGEKSISLSKREWECLSGAAMGKTHKEIANTFSISPRTVESYLNQVKSRAGAPYKSQLIELFHKNSFSS